MRKSNRESNMELLRIIAMLMIIVLHYFGENRQPQAGTPNEIIYFIFRSLAICGVDVFVLLTGYFSLRQNGIKVRKIFNLLLDVAFWEGLGFLLCVAFGMKAFGLKPMIRVMFPIIFGGRWFVKAYILLMLFVPFVNLVLRSIDKKAFQILLGIQLSLFCLWPSFLPNPPFDDYGFNFIHFISLYMIAGYLRMYVKKFPPKAACLAAYALCFGLVLTSKMMGWGYEWAYNSPFVIGEAVFLFLFFAQFRFDSSAVNCLASCAFGVFLIHTNPFFGDLGYLRLFHADRAINGSTILLILSVLLCAVFFYVFGFLMESGKRWLFSHTFDPILDRIPFLNHDVLVKMKEQP